MRQDPRIPLLNLGSYTRADDPWRESIFREQRFIAAHHSFERVSLKGEVSPADLPAWSLSGGAGVCRVPRGQPQAGIAPRQALAGVPRDRRGLQPALGVTKLLMLGGRGAS